MPSSRRETNPGRFERARNVTTTGALLVIPLLTIPGVDLLTTFWIPISSTVWKAVIMLVSLCVAIPLVQHVLRRMIDRIDAKERAAQVNAVDRIRDGSDEPFILYLRPFAADRIEPVRGRVTDPMVPESEFWELDEHMDEMTLAKACAALKLWLIVIGRTGDGSTIPPRTGATVLAPEEEWFDEFKGLTERASLLLVSPGTSRSLLRELEYLRSSGGLEKTIAVVAPAGHQGAGLPAIREKLSSTLGLEIPACEPMGAVFRWDSDGRAKCVCRLGRLDSNAFLRSLVIALEPPPLLLVFAAVPWPRRILLFVLLPVHIVLAWVGAIAALARGWWNRGRDLGIPGPARVAFGVVSIPLIVGAAGVAAVLIPTYYYIFPRASMPRVLDVFTRGLQRERGRVATGQEAVGLTSGLRRTGDAPSS